MSSLKTVVQINTVYNQGSTGKIVFQIQQLLLKEGYSSIAVCRYGAKSLKEKGVVFASSWLDNHLHNRLARITGLQGCFSKIRTWFFLKKLNKISPDIIHLHNLHANYINLKMLFKYIKKRNIKVIYTLHDCWALTGYCTHFDYAGCQKWQTNCNNCPIRKQEKHLLDTSSYMHKKKKDAFLGTVMTIVTPSNWLKNLVKQSFLGDYPVKVINNGIDLSTFNPTKSDFKKTYNLEDKFVLLGVAFDWGKKKGLDVFKKLAEKLNSDYQIVLVGVTETVKNELPKNVIAINKTQNQEELAKIYSSSDLFVNPTREDTFPTVNIEALACGTPVLTFKTGGSPEIIDFTCGSVVDRDDINSLVGEIERIKNEKPFTKENCVKRAQNYNKDDKFKEYVDLYEKI